MQFYLMLMKEENMIHMAIIGPEVHHSVQMDFRVSILILMTYSVVVLKVFSARYLAVLDLIVVERKVEIY